MIGFAYLVRVSGSDCCGSTHHFVFVVLFLFVLVVDH